MTDWCTSGREQGGVQETTFFTGDWSRAGSGTVGVVAARLGRRAVLIEMSPDYCEMARHRTAQMGLMVT